MVRKEFRRNLHLDLAFDYAAAGFWGEAKDLLSGYVSKSEQAYPIALYLLGYCECRLGNHPEAIATWADAANASAGLLFPSPNRRDDRASGCFGRRIHLMPEHTITSAICSTTRSVTKRQSASGKRVFRSIHLLPFLGEILGLHTSMFEKMPMRRLPHMRMRSKQILRMHACCMKRINCASVPEPAHLNAWHMLENHSDLVSQRDDLTVEFITLLNQTGRAEQALEMLLSRRFNPWEGGEGLVSGQYVWAHILLGRSLLESGDPQRALAHFSAAREYPQNLGEGKHLLTRETHLDYFAGLALSQMGREDEARTYWTRAAADDSSITWLSYYRAMSLDALGRKEEAASLLRQMRDFAQKQMEAEVKIDYFATSLPNLLLFEDDLQKRNRGGLPVPARAQ